MIAGARIGRRAAALALCAAAGIALWLVARSVNGPPDATTPEGAYVRLTIALSDGRERDVYDLLDDSTRSACEDVVATARRLSQLVLSHFPDGPRERALARYAPLAHGGVAVDFWLAHAADNGWLGRLRADLSGVASVERDGDGAAVVVTARGSRYPFARRSDGTYGLASFGPDLQSLSARLASDAELVEQAAEDYERANL